MDWLTINWSTVILVLLSCVVLYLWQSMQNPHNSPPGPAGLPIVGMMFTFSKVVKEGKKIEFISGLHEKYGPIVSFKAGVQRLVYINDPKKVVELFQNKLVADRPFDTLPAIKILAAGVPKGLLFSNGEPHDEMRRFSLLSMREFGLGKTSLDDVIITEASILGQHFEKVERDGGVVKDIRLHMHIACSNAIHHIIFGFRHEHDNPTWVKLMKDLDDIDNINPFAFACNYFPILLKFPALNNYLSNRLDERYTELNNSAIEYLSDQIDEHKKTYTPGEIRDFIDLYIKHESEEKKHYTPENIFATMLDLFKAGTATVAVTLTWALLYLIKQPETQKAVQEEIDKVIRGGEFKRSDQDKLIKTRAFINEVHRFASIAFLSAPRTPSQPINVDGYGLVPGDIIFGFLYSINNNKEHWKDPENFRYERWIDDNGELLKHDGNFFPFSTGQRVCPGKNFATIQMMLILVHLLQNYKFLDAPGYSSDGSLMQGFLRIPSEFCFRTEKRQH